MQVFTGLVYHELPYVTSGVDLGVVLKIEQKVEGRKRTAAPHTVPNSHSVKIQKLH